MKQINYNLTDMPDELVEFGIIKSKKHTKSATKLVNVKEENGIKRTEIWLNEGNEFNKSAGIYITYDCLKFESDKTKNYLVAQLAKDLNNQIKNTKKILCLGIGNPEITSDALGPKCINNIKINNKLGQKCQERQVCKYSPGVVGNTGIDSKDIVTLLIKKLQPDLILVIDSLCTRNFNRIGSSFQLSDAGLTPGSGVGESTFAINQKELGVKVIALGVPTVVHFRSILGEYVAEENILNRYNGLFVSPKEIDIIINFCAEVISGAINEVFDKKNGE